MQEGVKNGGAQLTTSVHAGLAMHTAHGRIIGYAHPRIAPHVAPAAGCLSVLPTARPTLLPTPQHNTHNAISSSHLKADNRMKRTLDHDFAGGNQNLHDPNSPLSSGQGANSPPSYPSWHPVFKPPSVSGAVPSFGYSGDPPRSSQPMNMPPAFVNGPPNGLNGPPNGPNGPPNYPSQQKRFLLVAQAGSENPTLPQLNFYSRPGDPQSMSLAGQPGQGNFGGPRAYANEPMRVLTPQTGPRSDFSAPGASPALSDKDKLGQGSINQRVRVVKACERCRNHKIKCTGLFPCINCQKHNQVCKFRQLLANDDAGGRVPGLEPVLSAYTPNLEVLADISGVTEPVDISETTSELPAQAKRAKFSKRYAGIGTSTGEGADHVTGAAGPEMNHPLTRPNPPNSSNSSESSTSSDLLYTRYLEQRVRYLESVVSRQTNNEGGPGLDRSLNYANTPSASKLDDIVDIQRPRLLKWRLCRRFQGALAIELCSSLYDGLLEQAKTQVEVPRTNYFGFNMSGCNYLKPEQLPQPPAGVKQISAAERKRLVDYFFAEINPLYAILHEKVFREQFKAFDDTPAAERPSNNMALYLAMLGLVTALSIRFIEFSKPEGPSVRQLLLEESLFQYSHRVISIFSLEWDSFELIQCWLLAALYLRVAHRQTSTFLTLGHAVTMARSMAIGQFEQVPHKCPPYERTKARRIFFATYTFDRIIGLQGGRTCGLTEADIARNFPDLDFAQERSRDDWVTLPAFAMLHIARLANFLNVTHSTELDSATADTINRRFEELHKWLDTNGFHDESDLFEPASVHPHILPLVKAQVKLHFYELRQCVYGRALFKFFGRRAAIEGLGMPTVLAYNKHIIHVLEKIERANVLFAPWYLTLQLLLTVGVTSLVFINGGLYVGESRRLLKQTMAVLQTLRHASVRDDSGTLVAQQRFRMVEECHWLFKMMSHIMTLHHEESLSALRDLGTDHGPSEVNKSRLDFEDAAQKPGGVHFSNLMNNEDGGKVEGADAWPSGMEGNVNKESKVARTEVEAPEALVDQYLDNLTWFDQWLDLNHGM